MAESKESILFSLEKISQLLDMVNVISALKLDEKIYLHSMVYGYVDAKVAEEELKKIRKYIKEKE